jgi:bacillithiol system protein YtxJ
VREDRALSQTVAAQTGVSHESPQVICLVGGKPFWHASHTAVTAAALGEVWRRCGSRG